MGQSSREPVLGETFESRPHTSGPVSCLTSRAGQAHTSISKIESFIRSKYESKRWAMDGPPPSDPSTLEDGSRQSHTHEGSNGRADPTPTSTSTTSAPAPAPASRTHPLLSRNMAPKPTKTAAPTPPIVDLIGDDGPSTAPPTAPAPVHAPVSTNPDVSSPPTQTAPAGAGIFDLDFRAPVAKPQTAKADIMSLFSSNSPTASFPSAPQAQNPYASWGGGGTSTNTTMQNPTQTALPTNPNSSGGGGWGGFQQMDQGVWGAQAAPPQPQQSPQQTPNHNLWGQPAPAQNTNASGNMWGAADPWAATAASPPVQKQQENDPFANIWK